MYPYTFVHAVYWRNCLNSVALNPKESYIKQVINKMNELNTFFEGNTEIS